MLPTPSQPLPAPPADAARQGGEPAPHPLRPAERARAAWLLAGTAGGLARGLRCLLRWGLWLVVAVCGMVLVAWLALHWAILPHLEQWRAPLETRASKALGVPVRIGAIQLESRGWMPVISLQQVLLLDPAGQPALTLPHIVAVVSPRALMAWDLRFEQLHIDGAALEIHRDTQGRVRVAGLDVTASAPGEPSAVSRWFFRQPEFVVRGASVRWTDERRPGPALQLDDVQLVVRNRLGRHAMRLDATPPPDWGQRFTLRARFTQSLLADQADWRRWNGQVHADVPLADLRRLREHVVLPFDLSEGRGALRAWVDVRNGQPTGATVDLALQAVQLQLASDLAPLAMAQVQGRLVGQMGRDGGSLRAEGFGFSTPDGLHWPKADLAMAWRPAARRAPAGGEFSAQQLDLGRVAQVAASLPLGDRLQALLDSTRPQGQVKDLKIRFDGPPDAPSHYQVQGQFSGLSLAAGPSPAAGELGRPGMENAQLLLDANERGGSARLLLDQGRLHLPGLWAEPELPLDQFSANLNWRIEAGTTNASGLPDTAAPRISLQVKDARFVNADAAGRLQASWSTGPDPASRFPGQLDLSGQLSRGQATRVARYLPLSLPEDSRRYVADAVQAGTLRKVDFSVKGDLAEFPFTPAKPGAKAPRGEFRILGQVEDGTLAYVPDRLAGPGEHWPVMTHLNGELEFNRQAMFIRQAEAQVMGVKLQQVKGGIADLEHQAKLVIDGRAQGALGDMLRYVNASPVGGLIDQALAQATARGNAELSLALQLPLDDIARSRVNGTVTLAGNDVRISPDTPLLGAARGKVGFSEQGFSVTGASARILGGSASFEGGLQTDGRLRFSGQGVATAEGLRQASELGELPRLAQVLSGQLAYRLNLGWTRGVPELTLSSNLVGLGIDLPAPLNKPADSALPLRLQTQLLDGTTGTSSTAGSHTPLRDQVRLELGSLLQLQYQREHPRDPATGQLLASGSPRVLRGGIAVQDSLPQPTSGVNAQLRLDQLNLDQWQAALARLRAPSGAGSASSQNTSLAASEAAASVYLPQTLALRVRQLRHHDRQVDNLVAELRQTDGGWQARLEADQLQGLVEVQTPQRSPLAGENLADSGSGGRVRARLSRLQIPRNEAEQVETLLVEQQPSSVPALDVVVDELVLGGLRLGKAEVDAVNRVDPASGRREWRLNRLVVGNPDARLTASGRWGEPVAGVAGVAGRRRTQLDFRLEVNNSGALLQRLGKGEAIRGGKGSLSGQVDWQGSPLSLDFASLGGQVAMAVEAGQFLKVDPGAARLLSVLSLQSLPRRLTLDFRDLFQQGFAFDSITGDIQIANGVARTNNLHMRGLQAAVMMEGEADLQREQQDIRVVVVPEINAGTASLAYAVINPAVGLGTFLAQMFLRRPLIQAGTREFHVTGPWSAPQVDRIDNTPGRSAGPARPASDSPSSGKPP